MISVASKIRPATTALAQVIRGEMPGDLPRSAINCNKKIFNKNNYLKNNRQPLVDDSVIGSVYCEYRSIVQRSTTRRKTRKQ